ncbi:signal peptide-containing protein [Theileria equi strain WA]|uniref:Signal peptide-containing protein n=1 Tax=Theileria equi strain WA TaxID=1537102 RepID=L0B250_THEEQ|nr:signal peptide-containing protein [Theileria equi strain WA]AFZ81321.1 signal peptide-containing protein [Theileria equi strain WA]|eukprot:XP_004830987.1 signal peptide-containing protein [Theileria equi strain WA]
MLSLRVIIICVTGILFNSTQNAQAAILKCHPHKQVCIENCNRKHPGGIGILRSLCHAGCSVSQCLLKRTANSLHV